MVDTEGTAFINPFNIVKSMAKRVPNGYSKTDLKEMDNNFHHYIKHNLENIIAENESGDSHILIKYLWLKDLLMWNIDPDKSKIKFEYLLK